MKLLEVTRPSDKAAERAKQAAKEEAMTKRTVAAYVRALTAPQYKPHARDMEQWLFGGGPGDTEALEELRVWTDAIGFMIGVKPNDKDDKDHEQHFRVFSHHLDIPDELVDFVCNEGELPEVDK